VALALGCYGWLWVTQVIPVFRTTNYIRIYFMVEYFYIFEAFVKYYQGKTFNCNNYFSAKLCSIKKNFYKSFTVLFLTNYNIEVYYIIPDSKSKLSILKTYFFLEKI